MFCTVCGAQVPEGSAYCEVCGAQVEQIQPQAAQPMPQAAQPMPQAVQPMPQAAQPMPQAAQPMPQAAQPIPQAVQPMPQAAQPMPQASQASMNQVMQQHEYARQMQQQFMHEAKDAEREVTQTHGMVMMNMQPQRPTPYPSIQHGEMSQSVLPEDNQVSQQYPAMMQQPAPRQPMMQQPSNDGKKLKKAPKPDGGAPGKKSKAPIIIAIIAILLAVVAVLVFVVIKPFGKKSNAQTKAIDRYFDAINDLDIEGIDRASYPKEILDTSSVGLKDAMGYNMLYSNKLGFVRGLATYDLFRTDQAILDSYPELDPKNYPDKDTYQSMMTDNDKFKNLYKDFSASYKLVNLYKWDEVTLARTNGLKTIELTDMDELIPYTDNGDRKYLDVEDAYVAQIKVEWYYGDKLYGFDKSWWDEPTLANKLQNPAFESYDKMISQYKDGIWTVVVYQYNGEWYIYPEMLSLAFNTLCIEE